MSTNSDHNTPTQHSQPIEIDSSKSTGRRRSSSVWSNPGLSPSTSPVLSGTMSALQTPSSFTSTFPRGGPPSPKTASTSPLTYFLSTSPNFQRWQQNSSGFPKDSTQAKDESAVVEDDDSAPLSPLRGHMRTSSMNWNTSPDRAAGVMRRLSLSGTLGTNRPILGTRESPPRTPPPSAVEKVQAREQAPPIRAPTPRRATTGALKPIAPGASPGKDPVPHRGPSPMGERMLKGHFDGFGF